jgi:hypothetical protein
VDPISQVYPPLFPTRGRTLPRRDAGALRLGCLIVRRLGRNAALVAPAVRLGSSDCQAVCTVDYLCAKLDGGGTQTWRRDASARSEGRAPSAATEGALAVALESGSDALRAPRSRKLRGGVVDGAAVGLGRHDGNLDAEQGEEVSPRPGPQR